jgi:hypothetical protein
MLPLAIIGAAGGIMGAAGALYEGHAAAKAGKYNAKVLQLKAQQLRIQADQEANQQMLKSRKVIGDMQASYAASGVTMEGSPLDIMEESIKYANEDFNQIKHQGEIKAREAEYDAKLARMRGKEAQKASYLSASGSLLMGASAALKA